MFCLRAKVYVYHGSIRGNLQAEEMLSLRCDELIRRESAWLTLLIFWH